MGVGKSINFGWHELFGIRTMEVGGSSAAELICAEKSWASTNLNRDLNQRTIEIHEPETGINWQKREFSPSMKNTGVVAIM